MSLTVRDGTGTQTSLDTSYSGGVHTPRHLSAGRDPLATTLQNAQTSAGNGTAAQLDGKYATLVLQVVGSGASGLTVAFEGSVDGSNYVSVEGWSAAGASATSASSDGVWEFDVIGFSRFRARVSAISAGSVTVTSNAVG